MNRLTLTFIDNDKVMLTHQQELRDCFPEGWQVQAGLVPGTAASNCNMTAPPCSLLWCVRNAHWATQSPQTCKYVVIYQI
jgi:hypothetical protein